ncbi:hypothetical protein BASA62_007911 [Batrachochytrium salamandrivorans]|nr:hypothetical protein BASA62_007911 [Batrachochytrium salamandrivorans]
MKLEAVTLFSLVAIATYASPAAYPENQANAQHSAIDAPVIVHLEKRVTVWNRFLEMIGDIEDAIGHKRRVKERQREKEYQDYLKQIDQEIEQLKQKIQKEFNKQFEADKQKERQKREEEDKIRQENRAEHQKQRKLLIQQEQEQEKEAQEYETQQEQKKENLRKQKQEEEDLKKKEQKEQQKSKVKYPKLRRLKNAMTVDRCILCDQQLLSTSIAHLVVECEQVAGHRIQSGLVPAIQKITTQIAGSQHCGL